MQSSVVFLADECALGEVDAEVLHFGRPSDERDALLSTSRRVVAAVLEECEALPKASSLPPLRYLPHLRVLERIGEEVGERLGEAGVAAFGLGADGVKVHEPRPEQGLRHGLQRLAHPPVQLDLVVKRAENVGETALLI